MSPNGVGRLRCALRMASMWEATALVEVSSKRMAEWWKVMRLTGVMGSMWRGAGGSEAQAWRGMMPSVLVMEGRWRRVARLEALRSVVRGSAGSSADRRGFQRLMRSWVVVPLGVAVLECLLGAEAQAARSVGVAARASAALRMSRLVRPRPVVVWPGSWCWLWSWWCIGLEHRREWLGGLKRTVAGV